mgnify:CR=1 FL=1
MENNPSLKIVLEISFLSSCIFSFEYLIPAGARYNDNIKSKIDVIVANIRNGFRVLKSGMMVAQYSNNYFHILDMNGELAWSYYAREKVVDVSFSISGGDIIIASENKIHWFQNEGFLRLQIEDSLTEVENLFEKVSVYDSNLDLVNHDIQKAKSLKLGNFISIKKSFQLIFEVRQRLSMLQQRHVGYLDALPLFLDNLIITTFLILENL